MGTARRAARLQIGAPIPTTIDERSGTLGEDRATLVPTIEEERRRSLIPDERSRMPGADQAGKRRRRQDDGRGGGGDGGGGREAANHDIGTPILLRRALSGDGVSVLRTRPLGCFSLNVLYSVFIFYE
jgi:hypothetical protein